MPSTSPMGDVGAGSSSLGSGLSGFAQQLADLIGGLIGSADDVATDTADLGEPDDPDEPDPDEPDPDEPDPDEPATEEVAAEDEEPAAPIEEPIPEPAVEEPAPPPTTPAPPPPESPPAAPPMFPEAVAGADEPTPCEIAADELPQVGE
jgi:hypothetical protein